MSSDSSQITVILSREDGTPVVDGTVVNFTTSLGSIPATGTTHNGVVTVALQSTGRSGVAKVRAQSGTVNQAAQVDVVVGPTVEGLGDRLGVLLFQFAPQDVSPLGGAEAFAEKLCAFLEALPALPKGWVRDYCFTTEGWVKDADMNQAVRERVGPLPYRGIGGYPYDEDWEQKSYPIGNGYLGANLFGRTDSERIQITDKTLANEGLYNLSGMTSFAEVYLDLDHPIQQSIVAIVTDMTGLDSGPIGIDGCGAPTLRGTIGGLATAFSRLGSDEELAPIARAMARFGALVADNTRPDGRASLWWGGPQKVGAAGLYAMTRGGLTVAAKSHSGSSEIAVAAALIAAKRLGALTPAMENALKDQIRPPTTGGGRTVGNTELIEA